jgi:O-antigen/teichoic acid export membrane protein
MKIMTPNAVKMGVTTIGAFLTNKAVIVIAPLYLSLSDIASYGTTKQMIDLITAIGYIWFNTFYPKLTLYRVNNDVDGVKRLYIKGKLSLIAVYIFCGFGLILIGPYLLALIHSKTHLLSSLMILIFLTTAFLEANHGLAAGLLITKNEVPFVKASLLSGIASTVLLFICLDFTSIGIWGMILAPGIIQATYQNWKWPLLVIRELDIKAKNYWVVFCSLLKN